MWLILWPFPLFSVSFMAPSCFLSKFVSLVIWLVALLFRRAPCWYVSSCPALGTVWLLRTVFLEVTWLLAAKAELSIWCIGSTLWFTALHTFTICRLRNVLWWWAGHRFTCLCSWNGRLGGRISICPNKRLLLRLCSGRWLWCLLGLCVQMYVIWAVWLRCSRLWGHNQLWWCMLHWCAVSACWTYGCPLSTG